MQRTEKLTRGAGKKKKKVAAIHEHNRAWSWTEYGANGQLNVPFWVGKVIAGVVAAGSGKAVQQGLTGEDFFTLSEFLALALKHLLALEELMIKHIYKGVKNWSFH